MKTEEDPTIGSFPSQPNGSLKLSPDPFNVVVFYGAEVQIDLGMPYICVGTWEVETNICW